MNSKIKSLLWSFTIVFGIFYATITWVRIFWNSDDNEKFSGRVLFILLLKFLLIPSYIIGIYHLVGPYEVENYYKPLTIFELIYFFAGIIIGQFINDKFLNKSNFKTAITVDDLYKNFKKRKNI